MILLIITQNKWSSEWQEGDFDLNPIFSVFGGKKMSFYSRFNRRYDFSDQLSKLKTERRYVCQN